MHRQTSHRPNRAHENDTSRHPRTFMKIAKQQSFQPEIVCIPLFRCRSREACAGTALRAVTPAPGPADQPSSGGASGTEAPGHPPSNRHTARRPRGRQGAALAPPSGRWTVHGAEGVDLSGLWRHLSPRRLWQPFSCINQRDQWTTHRVSVRPLCSRSDPQMPGLPRINPAVPACLRSGVCARACDPLPPDRPGRWIGG